MKTINQEDSRKRRTIREILKDGASQLSSSIGIDSRHEAEWVLSCLLKESICDMYLREESVPDEIARRFEDIVSNRCSGFPMQYILGEAAFCGESFKVSPGVFIPRPETETVVMAMVEVLKEHEAILRRPLKLLDLGTGSGAIAITLARHLPTCTVLGVELSCSALKSACSNIAKRGLRERVTLVQGSWAEAVRGLFDGIISNPPYVPSTQVDHLPLDVRQEPRLSLDGGGDGMDAIRALLLGLPRLLNTGGYLSLECGESQVDRLTRLLNSRGWVKSVTALSDLTGRPRGVLIVKR